MKRHVSVTVLLLLALVAAGRADDRHACRGLVLEVDAARRTFVASIESIPGVMPAMRMPFQVRDPKELAGLVPGAMIEFTLVIGQTASYAEGVRVRRVQNLEQDPLAARRLALLREIGAGVAAKTTPLGAIVPDFTLIDQKSRPVTLSKLRGKVVAINFMYTTCQLPDFCLRIVNHFGVLQKRLRDDLGPNLIFLTITFDPIRDQPEVLDRYASQWKPDANVWRFLTGPVPDVERVLGLFGVSAFPNEGLMDHALHTVVIDRDGRIVANIEGNRYSSDQLFDLIQGVLKRGRTAGRSYNAPLAWSN
jgi:protein SCO1/2